jgi:hypothetical protein
VDHQPSYLQMLFRQRCYGTIPYLFAFVETAGAVMAFTGRGKYDSDMGAFMGALERGESGELG